MQHSFKQGDWVVYPAHGVGCIQQMEKLSYGGQTVDMLVIHFDADRMTVRVPLKKAHILGLRKVADKKTIQQALNILKGRAKSSRMLWSQRIASYEAKIYSGNLERVAEVLRDLKRHTDLIGTSFSERNLFEEAHKRLARELAVTQKMTIGDASKKLDKLLQVG